MTGREQMELLQLDIVLPKRAGLEGVELLQLEVVELESGFA